jgi:hypothetical protein
VPIHLSTDSQQVRRLRPKPMSSLVASAKRLTSETLRNRTFRSSMTSLGWQEDAWEMYDLVGEQRFLATTLANRLSQARFFVGRIDSEPNEDPVEVEEGLAVDLLHAVGGGVSGLRQIVNRLGVNLFVSGEAWLAGIPTALVEHRDDEEPDLADLDWRLLSVSEVTTTRDGTVTLKLDQDESSWVNCVPEDVFLIRVWRPHPRHWWEADSPTRSSLAVLRELVGLTMHISAQVDSRLAGAGLLVVPQSAQRSLSIGAGTDPDDMVGENDMFTEALMEAMLTPIGDRANASALVPLVVTVPDESTGLFNYMTFSKPLDTEARSLREEAIRRLALGQDAPPELLLGTAGMNHWGAWLVQEEVVGTHIEPPLALICDALTTQYLRPVLIEQGMSEEEANAHAVWFDVEQMVVRPNRSADALVLHERGVIGDSSLRDASGFTEDDAPTTSEVDSAIMEMVKANPALLYKPGARALREQLTAILDGKDIDPLSQKSKPAEPAATAPAATTPAAPAPTAPAPAPTPGGNPAPPVAPAPAAAPPAQEPAP